MASRDPAPSPSPCRLASPTPCCTTIFTAKKSCIVQFFWLWALTARGDWSRPFTRRISRSTSPASWRPCSSVLATNRLYVRVVLWEIAAGVGLLRALPLPTLTAMDAGLLDRLPVGVDLRQLLTTLLGATVVYFFDDPLLERLFGDDRFGSDAVAERAHHLRRLTAAVLVVEAR